MGAHPRQDFLAGERLRNIVCRAGIEPLDLRGKLLICGDEQDGGLGGAGLSLELAAKVQSIPVRQVDVEQDQIGMPLFDDRGSADYVKRADHLETPAAENALDQKGCGDIIIHNQDQGRAGGASHLLSFRKIDFEQVVATLVQMLDH